MNYKAVIFDLDGTLLDSLEGIAVAMNNVLERLGYPVHPEESYGGFVCDGIIPMIERALPENKRALHDTNQMIEEYRQNYDISWPKHSPPYPGIIEMLEILNEKKIPMGILSNKNDVYTKRMTEELLPAHLFKLVLGTRPGVPLKPEPDAALEVAEVLGIKPEDTVFVGDSGVDMQTGKRSGMLPVGVLWGFRDKEELLEKGAGKLIEHPMELVDIITG